MVNSSVPSSSGRCPQRGGSPVGESLREPSVPSSSGRCPQPDHADPDLGSAAEPFSPLIIGEVPSTVPLPLAVRYLQSPHHRGGALNSLRERHRPPGVLQSPHHRGGALNFGGPAATQVPICASVPSSSGRCPQRDALYGENGEKMAPFSPLIIGEVPSTDRRNGGTSTRGASVPSSSGRCPQRYGLGSDRVRA